MNRRSALSLALLSVLAAATVLALAGCGRALATSPDTGAPPAGAAAPAASVAAGRTAATRTSLVGTVGGTVGGVIGQIADGVGDILQNPTFLTDPLRIILPGPLRFITTLIQIVLPGTESQVKSGRWSLAFHPGSLQGVKPISIAQASDGTMRVQFGPDGTKFGQAVDLSIDYSGTALDPSSRSYDPSLAPVFLYFDPAQNGWVEMPSVNDVAHRTLHAKLQHFSTYGVGTRAGW